MKTCHLCQKIVKTHRATYCLTCKRTHCYPCIAKYYPQQADSLIPKTQAEAIKNIKTNQCFYCLKECKCYKCKTKDSIVFTPFPSNPQEEAKSIWIERDQQPIQQSGLFRGKKITELPHYLQIIYMKKKVLYSKHQLSLPSSNILPPEPNEQQEELQNKQSPKAVEEAQLVQFIDNGMNQEFNFRKNQMKIEMENQEGDAEASSSNSESGEPGESKLDNEGEQQNEEMIDEGNQNSLKNSQEPPNRLPHNNQNNSSDSNDLQPPQGAEANLPQQHQSLSQSSP